MNRVFVYGTLREGMYNYEKYYKGHVRKKQMGYVKGELYTIKDKVYPALIEGEQMILGEILELDESFSQAAVDEMEGHYGEDCIHNEYNKIICDIYDMDQKTVIDRLPVYMYNLKNPQQKDALQKRIVSGDYVSHLMHG